MQPNIHNKTQLKIEVNQNLKKHPDFDKQYLLLMVSGAPLLGFRLVCGGTLKGNNL